jgi:hypothetical protein
MFDQLSAEIPASLIKGFPTTTRTTRTTTTTTTTKQNVDPAVHFVYSRVKIILVLTREPYTSLLQGGGSVGQGGAKRGQVMGLGGA